MKKEHWYKVGNLSLFIAPSQFTNIRTLTTLGKS